MVEETSNSADLISLHFRRDYISEYYFVPTTQSKKKRLFSWRRCILSVNVGNNDVIPFAFTAAML